ncbi:MAG: hypothetical protein HOP29_16080 [Phycisphaerales bacterium]|nr:hypothetical protein [Phycisphaerales bacterium]
MRSKLVVMGGYVSFALGSAALAQPSCPGTSCSGSVSPNNDADYVSLQSGDYDVYTTWCVCNGSGSFRAATSGEKPGANSRVTLVEGMTVTVDADVTTEACDDLIIESGSSTGVLLIAAGGGDLTVNGTLTMQAPGGGETACRIEFTGSGAAAVLEFVISTSAGQEIVVDGPAKIEVTGAAVLTVSSGGIIKGKSANTDPLEIAGEIENDGDISVTEAFNLKLTGDGLATGSSGTITVNHASGSMQWLVDSSALDTVSATTGLISLQNGTLNFDTPLEFHGTFEMTKDGIVDTEALTGTQTALFCDGASCS